MAIDPKQFRRAFHIYRTVKMAGRVRVGYERAESMLQEHMAQLSLFLDGSEIANRIVYKQVRPEDVRVGARLAINHSPRVLRAVARHVRKQKRKNAKA